MIITEAATTIGIVAGTSIAADIRPGTTDGITDGTGGAIRTTIADAWPEL